MLLSRIITITISYDGRPCQKMYLEFKKKKKKKQAIQKNKRENDKDNNFDQTEIIPIDIPPPPTHTPLKKILIFNFYYLI